jgi:putative membrane protein
MVSRLLQAGDRERIEAAVRQIEQRSSLEVVVAIVARSADYWQFRVGLSASWGLAAGCAILLFLPQLQPWWAVLSELPVALLAYLISGIRSVHRMLIPESYSADAVQARAFQLFSERGLHHTRDHTGLLLLVSELEHRVVFLGDSGVHVHVGEQGWQRYVDLIVRRIREGRAVSGILEALGQIESSAGRAQPVMGGDTNELPDSVVEG